MKMKKLIFIFFFLCHCSLHIFGQCQYGDPCMVPNPSCFDSDYPEINQFVTAGVVGGIPTNLTVIDTLNPGDNLQVAINSTSSSGGVILLNAGVYPVTSMIYMKSNVVLRGVNSASVILESTIRSTWAQGKKNTIIFQNVTKAGLEDLTIYYRVDNNEPVDRQNFNSGGYCDSCFQNNPHGDTTLYVRQVEINLGSSNCWIDGCRILKSGTDPIYIRGNHNTIRNCYVDRCYNKGGSGNGYIDLRGDYNLFVGDTIRRIRHFAPQLDAQYNVIFKNHLEVDVNFHNGDDGNNLIEQNTIYIPTWRGWDVFSAGVSGTHAPPGPNNIMVNNVTNFRWFGPRYCSQDTIYTFTSFAPPVATTLTMPTCNTFYPMDQVFTPLPVEWLTFDAQLYPEHKVQLNWTLLSQLNNDYFTIEKSTTGIDWKSLGIIDGAGSCHEQFSYTFVDDNPFIGINYYRIRQTDFNGQSSFSDCKSVIVNAGGNCNIYPNPAGDKFFVQAKGIKPSGICIRNNQGQEIPFRATIFKDDVIQLDCTEMSEGLYFVEIKQQQRLEIIKLKVNR